MNLPKNYGLTTTKAPFIEAARAKQELFIHQPYELYSPDNQEAWRRLWERMLPLWQRYASSRFLEGMQTLAFNPASVPRLSDINQALKPLTGFQAKAVAGFVPGYIFLTV